MSEMVERVAEAIFKANSWVEKNATPQIHQDRVARAAIEAMREPTGSMCEAILKLDYSYATFKMGSYAGPMEWWRAMIDEALK